MAWERFCGYAGVDPICRGIGCEELEGIIIRFLAFEVGLRGMSPDSIRKVYLGGIASYFVGAGIRNEFAEARRSAAVSYVLRGYMKIYSLMHPAGEAKKLAFTIELVKYLRNILTAEQLRQRGGLFAKGLELALKFGIYFLMRKSEYLPGYARETEPVRVGMRFSVVRFYDDAGNVLKWKAVGRVCAKIC